MGQPVPCIWDQGLTLQPNQSPSIVSHLRTAQPSLKFRTGMVCDGLPRPWAALLSPLQHCGNLRIYGFPFPPDTGDVDCVSNPSFATGQSLSSFLCCNSLPDMVMSSPTAETAIETRSRASSSRLPAQRETDVCRDMVHSRRGLPGEAFRDSASLELGSGTLVLAPSEKRAALR